MVQRQAFAYNVLLIVLNVFLGVNASDVNHQQNYWAVYASLIAMKDTIMMAQLHAWSAHGTVFIALRLISALFVIMAFI